MKHKQCVKLLKVIVESLRQAFEVWTTCTLLVQPVTFVFTSKLSISFLETLSVREMFSSLYSADFVSDAAESVLSFFQLGGVYMITAPLSFPGKMKSCTVFT